MPVEDGIGQGRFTPRKLDDFEKIVSMHLNITYNVLGKLSLPRKYWYVDCTAGRGYVPGLGRLGCAPLFVQTIESKFGDAMMYRADFIDIEEDHLADLSRILSELAVDHLDWHSHSWHFHPGDYCRITPKLAAQGQWNDFGLIFVDPNNVDHDLPTLANWVQKKQKMEILLYIQTTGLKRAQQYGAPKLSDFIEGIEKKYWLVRDPLPGDAQGWTFLLGSNTNRFDDYKAIGLRRLDGDRAQRSFDKFNNTEKERRDRAQPGLFDLRED